MGVLFNDPDVDLDDIHWYNIIYDHVMKLANKNEGLVVFDKESGTHSCYVELHRTG